MRRIDGAAGQAARPRESQRREQVVPISVRCDQHGGPSPGRERGDLRGPDRTVDDQRPMGATDGVGGLPGTADADPDLGRDSPQPHRDAGVRTAAGGGQPPAAVVWTKTSTTSG